MIGKNLGIAALYNALVFLCFLYMEFTTQDVTGQGIIGIPFYLVLFTVIHCTVIAFTFFRRKRGFGAYLLNVFAIAGFNFVAGFVDLFSGIVVLNVFKR